MAEINLINVMTDLELRERSKNIVALCKRRGFVFQSYENYGGLQGVYDFGPNGIELKNNLKKAWWSDMVYKRDDVEGLDSAILTSPKALKHSGHLDTFADEMVDCLTCKFRFRSDEIDFKNLKQCPKCNSSKLTEPRDFNLMFKTNFGPIISDECQVFLRPETAQGIFNNFKHVLDSSSRKLPFGIAQIGKAFRNEITPRNFIFRVREFEQMELEYFIESKDAQYWFDYWVEERLNWWQKQGLHSDKLKLKAQPKEDLSHYSLATTDITYEFPHGFEELEGIANRQDFDLGSHTKSQDDFNIQAKVIKNDEAVMKFNYTDVNTKKQFIPFVIEPSAGLERGIFAILDSAYTVEELPNGETRVVLKFAKHLAPVKAAVIPLAKNKPEIVNKALKIVEILRKLGLGIIKYEDTGNVGKAYRRNDEIGTPLCITVDFETIDNHHEQNFDTVTIRHRDTMQQERIAISDIQKYIVNFYTHN